MVQGRNLEANCSWRQWSSTYLFQLEKLAFVLQDIRYTISDPYLVFWNVVPEYRAEVCDPPYRTMHLNLIGQVRSHGFSAQYSSRYYCGRLRSQFQLNGMLCVSVRSHDFSAQYSSRCYCGRLRSQFQLNGMLCELIERQVVNWKLNS